MEHEAPISAPDDDELRRGYKELQDESTIDSSYFKEDKEVDGIFQDRPNSQSSTLSLRWRDFWFPPHVPRSCQLFRVENMAIPVSYLMVGLLQGLSGPLMNVWPLDLGATEAQQATVAILGSSLPSSFKLLFGFLSDNAPICGYRRKSYMVVGWCLASLSMWLLLWWSNARHFQPNSGQACFSNAVENYSNGNDNNNNNNYDSA